MQRAPERMPLGPLQRSLASIFLCYVLRGQQQNANIEVAAYLYERLLECAPLAQRDRARTMPPSLGPRRSCRLSTRAARAHLHFWIRLHAT